MICSSTSIKLYDASGANYTTIDRYPGDIFQINPAHNAFMLVQKHESILATDQKDIYSFQVYTKTGQPDYTSVVELDVFSDDLNYQLTNTQSLLLNVSSEAWLMELKGEDTLVYIDLDQQSLDPGSQQFFAVGKLKRNNEYLSAKVLRSENLDDSLSTELRLWNNDESAIEPIRLPGGVAGIRSLPSSDYYFLELDYGDRSSLSLFHHTTPLQIYPWKSWKIDALGTSMAFIVSEQDLNVVNLGDGTLVSSVHPIDLSSVSDACYLSEYGLFLYLRYDHFYTEAGQPAFRNFELEGIEKSGRIVHKSSFGTWSTSLPKITPLGKDLFAIHIYNAVLLYRMELKR